MLYHTPLLPEALELGLRSFAARLVQAMTNPSHLPAAMSNAHDLHLISSRATRQKLARVVVCAAYLLMVMGRVLSEWSLDFGAVVPERRSVCELTCKTNALILRYVTVVSADCRRARRGLWCNSCIHDDCLHREAVVPSFHRFRQHMEANQSPASQHGTA